MIVKLDKDYDVSFTGLTFRKYREIFGRSLYADLADNERALSEEVIENTMWLLCYLSDDVPPIDEWLEMQEPLAVYTAWGAVYKNFVDSIVSKIVKKKNRKKATYLTKE